eukprot:1175388-Prorocentrum_minimum.AAC.2
MNRSRLVALGEDNRPIADREYARMACRSSLRSSRQICAVWRPLGLDTLSSHLVTRELNSPTNSLRVAAARITDTICLCRALSGLVSAGTDKDFVLCATTGRSFGGQRSVGA